MSFCSSSRSRIVYSSLLALVVLVIFVPQIWLCLCPDCKAVATRMLAENGAAAKLKDNNIMATNNNKEPKQVQHFNGRRGASSFNKTEKGLEESKRKVPSCPDPLHN